MPVVIGIDPSLTGTAICYPIDDEVVTRRMSSESRGVHFYDRFSRYIDLVGDVSRKIRNAIDADEIAVFIEGYSFGSNETARWSVEYGALLRSELLNISGKITEVAPTQLKKFATGKGGGKSAGKEFVMAHVQKRWGRIFETNDECDAFVLYKIGRAFCGLEECATSEQRAVIDALKNPVKKSKKRKVTT